MTEPGPATPAEPFGGLLGRLRFGPDGLLPAVAQDSRSGEVLMLAWMSRESVRRTLEEGRVTYHSRSRGGLWRKGDTSGNIQRLVEMRVDCDADALLLRVEQVGPACHTGERTCFFRVVGPDGTLCQGGQPGD